MMFYTFLKKKWFALLVVDMCTRDARVLHTQTSNVCIDIFIHVIACYMLKLQRIPTMNFTKP